MHIYLIHFIFMYIHTCVYTNPPVYTCLLYIGNSCVQGVSHALHSPLMAMTNAISGMTIVGGMLQLGMYILYCVVLYCIVLHCIVLHCII